MSLNLPGAPGSKPQNRLKQLRTDGRDSATLPELRRRLGVLAVYQSRQYVAYRKRPDGSFQEIAIEILDGGEEIPAGVRFRCVARASDERSISGNPASTVEEALSLLHWEELD